MRTLSRASKISPACRVGGAPRCLVAGDRKSSRVQGRPLTDNVAPRPAQTYGQIVRRGPSYSVRSDGRRLIAAGDLLGHARLARTHLPPRTPLSRGVRRPLGVGGMLMQYAPLVRRLVLVSGPGHGRDETGTRPAASDSNLNIRILLFVYLKTARA